MIDRLRGSLLTQEIDMAEKPDFTTMSGKELVAAYNKYSGKVRSSSFVNSKVGVAACEKAYASYLEGGLADRPTRPAAKVASEAKKTEKKVKSPKSAKPTKTVAARGPRRSLDAKIVVLAPQNPRREGTFAFAHFQKMQKSKTVGDYLNKFDEGKPRRTASQWLWNTVNDGHVRVDPA